MKSYDVIVIGGGAAGLVACKVTAGLGKKTAIIEIHRFGGDCTWFGCVPSKTLIKAANVAFQATQLDAFGLKTANPVHVDGSHVMTHVRSVIQGIASEHEDDAMASDGIDVYMGASRFLDGQHLEVGTQTLKAKRFILATGSHPLIPDIPGLQDIPYLTNQTLFDLEQLPKSMIVLGAGPIGIEMAAALNRLGVKVTVVHRSSNFLKKDDPELADQLRAQLVEEGLDIRLNTQPLQFTQENGEIRLDVQTLQGPDSLQTESVLVAIGREPNLDGLALDKAGVTFDTHGVHVDKHLRTTVKNIYACGDLVPPYQFSHVSEYEAVIAATNAAFGLPLRKTNYDHILWATFTDPELAHAGLTEEEARALHGDSIRVYRWQYNQIDRAKTDLTHRGQGKYILNKRGKLVGIHILGHGAAELMHEAQLAKTMGLKFSKIASVIHAYPSYSDIVRQPAKRALIDELHQKIRLVKTMGKLFGVLLVLGLCAVLLKTLPINAWMVAALTWVDSLNAWGPVFVALFYILACVLFIPGSVLTLGAGFLFKTVLGTITVSIGATLGACAAFIVGRTVARARIEKKVAGNAKFTAIDAAVAKQGFKIVLLTRLSPVFPFNLLNYAFGLTKVSFWHYALASWIGMLPGTIMYVYFGTGLRTLADAATGVETGMAGKVFVGIGILLAVAVATLITHIAKKALKEAVA